MILEQNLRCVTLEGTWLLHSEFIYSTFCWTKTFRNAPSRFQECPNEEILNKLSNKTNMATPVYKNNNHSKKYIFRNGIKKLHNY